MRQAPWRTVALGAAALTAVLGCGRGDEGARSAADREVVQRIRQSLVADDSLSTNAKNVAIDTEKDSVTLRGSVTTEQERATVAAKAKQAAPDKKIENELVVASR